MSALHACLPRLEPSVYWLDDSQRPEPLPSLTGTRDADLVVVGGGYTGLWTALRSVERYPGSSVVVLDAGSCGDQASGRNGGFVSASLTHGFGNGITRWPSELALLDRLGSENLAAIGETITRHGIDCNWETTGELDVALAPHQFEELAEVAEAMTQHGHQVELLDQDQTRRLVDSPAYVGGLLDRTGTALVEPARLAWGLRQACLDQGVTIHEASPVTGLEKHAGSVSVRTRHGSVRAGRVALATNAFPPLLRRLKLMTVPVYDCVLMTEPLSTEQLASIGWSGREGVGDSANQFHYYRLTRDNRILWGGYDAVYYFGSQISRSREQAATTHRLLAEQFFETFPQLEGVRFTHRWGGVIDTCTRFTAFFGTAHQGRVAYATGYTGLGVGATRFGADVMLDLLHGEDTERTRSQMVQQKPLPLPPEPFRYAGITLTRHALDQADRNQGRRNLWLRSLDKLGLGFDSLMPGSSILGRALALRIGAAIAVLVLAAITVGWCRSAHLPWNGRFDSCVIEDGTSLVLTYTYGASNDEVATRLSLEDGTIVVGLRLHESGGVAPAIALHGEVRYTLFGSDTSSVTYPDGTTPDCRSDDESPD